MRDFPASRQQFFSHERNSQQSRCSFHEPGTSHTANMLLMPTQLALYQEMGDLSSRMVEAARANDWDLLITLECSVAILRNSVIDDNDNGNLSSSELKLKSQLIQRILSDDAEVRRHTEPWMEQLRQFLGSDVKRRQIEQTYGTNT